MRITLRYTVGGHVLPITETLWVIRRGREVPHVLVPIRTAPAVNPQLKNVVVLGGKWQYARSQAIDERRGEIRVYLEKRDAWPCRRRASRP